MGPGRLFWKLFLGNVLLLAVMLGTCVWLIAREVERFQDQELTRSLQVQATALREVVADRFDETHAAELDGLVKRIGQGEHQYLRVTLILADGKVLADSESDPQTMEPHGGRPEVRAAMSGGSGEDTRLSHTLGRMMKYVAVPIEANGAATKTHRGVVRVAMPVRTISEQAGSMQRLIWATGVLIMAAAAALALGLALLWSRPIRRITLAAQSLSQGDLSTRVPAGGSDELAVLGRSLNEMRGRLSGQLETIDRQRRTLESMLIELHEGVVVSGPDGRIVLINPAAVRMLGLPADSGKGVSRLTGQAVEAYVPRHELQQMLLPAADRADTKPGRNVKERADTIREVRLPSPEGGADVNVLARASDVLLPASGREAEHGSEGRPGRLLVLTDVTALTRMVQVKADFATNASHELRTPLAAIRAALETLAPMDVSQEADSARHFIEVIARHSRRLELLVADLLELSRLESSRAQFQPAAVRLRELLDDICGQRAEELARKELKWTVDGPAELNQILANPHLLRITLDNIIDNAIKFTEPRGHVRIELRETQAQDGRPRSVCIQVTDDGCGIAADEQARVFERFYQVERARSGGAMRGTGLGLSIVRHAVAAMKGSIQLESEPGKGTSVTITIPQPAASPMMRPG
jgi:two-component system, OmpR family, phosphate regulon sensor histidine kinase PhoR